MDDGFPTTGRVVAMYLRDQVFWANGEWASNSINPTPPIAAGPTTCYDTGGSATGAVQYSMSNSGSQNCAVSYQFIW
jgi:hypothetical protein